MSRFVLAGMFDFQIEEDVQIAKEALAKAKRERSRGKAPASVATVEANGYADRRPTAR